MIKTYSLVACLILLFGCGASSSNLEIEEAQYALDGGNWNAAITKANEALVDDPSNVEASLLLSSAYAGRGGFRILPLAAKIATHAHRRQIFAILHDDLASTSFNTSDLRKAILALITQLTPQPTAHHPMFSDHEFQSGLLIMIEGFVLPALESQPLLGGPIDVDAITEEMRDTVNWDFLYMDDKLVSSGVGEDDDMLATIRQNYCVLHNVSMVEDGFDLAALRDLTLCQLSPNDGISLTDESFQSALVHSCSDFNYDNCESAPPTVP